VGDVKTHREIYETFIRPHVPSGVDPIYVELGNFLTDVSQFRDPWAHVGGKAEVWRKTKAKLPWYARLPLVADIVGIDEYLDELLGRPDPGDPKGRRRVPHGKLAAWFREVIYAYGLERSFRRKEDPKDYLIPPDEFQRLYGLHYTQYFPHEHLDFQPGPTGRLDDFTPSRVPAADGTTPRRIVAYLDEDIEYVSDLLTRIERDWARKAAVAPEVEHDLLVRFGHACHAIEDFFFHSNFSELAEALARPGQDVQRFQPDETVDEHDLEGDRVPPPASIRWDRIFFRRLRQPVYGPDGETQFSASQSLPVTIVFTAAIPMPDIFHTFFDAIGFLTEQPTFDVNPLLDRIRTACRSANPKGELLNVAQALPLDQMKDLPWAIIGKLVSADEAERDKAYEAYRCMVKHHVFERVYATLALTGEVHVSVSQAVARACQIERDLWSFRRFLTEEKVGAAKFMIDLLAEGREVFAAARKKNEELDATNDREKADGVAPEQRTGWLPSFNGSTAERIGTHSLMSKDSVRKQPLRRQTMNTAGFTVSYVTKTLAAQRPGGAPVPDGVDWAELLRHFLTHPDQARPTTATAWWHAARDWNRTEAGRPTEAHQVKPVPGAGPAERAAAVTARAAETGRGKLELLYNDLSEVGEKRFRSAVNTEWVVDSIILGGVVGGVAGLIGAHDGSAGEVLLGGLCGGVTGALASGLLSGIGTLISEETGAVVGLLAGLTAAAIGGHVVGEKVQEA
jgi:hypothetical protein